MSYASRMLDSDDPAAVTADAAILATTIEALSDCAEACRRSERVCGELAVVLK